MNRWLLGVLGFLGLAFSGGLLGTGPDPVRLFVKEVSLGILGKEVTVIAIEQADGTHGYSPEQSDGFHVEVVNQLKVPTSIHWHGLVLPNLMDGVPYVTQPPIPPGGSFRYDFPLKQSGTYWMHSHYGLQEQLFNSAPMIIWTPEERAKADRQLVVMFSDFSFTPPGKILKDLKDGIQMPGMAEKASGKMDMADAKKMAHMEASQPDEVIAQRWDDQKQTPDARRRAKTRGRS
jgi:FtsP/CotA-like multicopper oxidase with cupredoxin domain